MGQILDFSDKSKAAVMNTVKSLAEDPDILAFKDVALLLPTTQVLNRLREVFETENINDILDPLEQKIPELRLALEVASDRAQEAVLKRIIAITEQTLLKVRLLLDIADFQTEFNSRKKGKVRHFSLTSIDVFTRNVVLPKYGMTEFKFKKFLDSVYDEGGYRRLAADSGLPVIVNPDDLEEVKNKLTEDLWRIYNEKNNLPQSNRRYIPGAQLPVSHETYYTYYFFQKIWGGFNAAVDTVILERSNLKSGADNSSGSSEVLGEDLIREYLIMSLSDDFSFPGQNEKDYKKWQEIRQKISRILIEDLEKVINYLSADIRPLSGGGANYVLSEPLLLLHSKYLKEYHATVFSVWLTPEELENVTNHRNKIIQKRLKDMFFRKRNTRQIQGAKSAAYFNPQEINPLKCKDLNYAKTKGLIEKHVLRRKFDLSHGRPNLARMKEVLNLYVEHGFSVRFEEDVFMPSSRRGATKIKYAREKLQFFKEHPEVPFYMRQILLAGWFTGKDILQRKWDYFAGRGIVPEFFVHFLHYQSQGSIQRVANNLTRAEKYNEYIIRYHEKNENLADWNFRVCVELLSPYVSPEEMPSREVLEKLNPATIQARIARRKKKNQPIDVKIICTDACRTRPGNRPKKDTSKLEKKEEAIREMEMLGFSWEKMPPLVKRQSPISILRRLKMLGEAGVVRFDFNKLVFSDENIRAMIAGKNREAEIQNKEEAEFFEFLREREITNMPDYIKSNLKRRGSCRSYLLKMRQIEAGGVPFKEEYWWVVNGPESQRQQFIEKNWRILSKDRYFAELAEIYGFPVEEIPNCVYGKKLPFTLRKYLKILKQLGHMPTGYWFNGINLRTVENFRDFVEKKLIKKRDKRKKSLTYEEAKWANKRELVKTFRGEGVLEIDGFLIDEIIEECSDEEFDYLKCADCKEKLDMPLLEKIAQRLRRKDEVEKALWEARMDFADMDYFCENEQRMDECLKRIATLRKLKVPVTNQALYEDWSRIPELAEIFSDEGLTVEQEKIRLFLENINCNWLIVAKLTRMEGVDLDEVKRKVRFFQKMGFDISDYEDYLEYPYDYCRKVAAPLIKMSLKRRSKQIVTNE